MEDEDTEYQRYVIDRYLPETDTRQKEGFLIGLVLAPKEHGYEDEMLAWLKENPQASLIEAMEHEMNMRPPVVIVDDDEDEED